MKHPNFGNGPVGYDVQHVITIATEYGAFEDVPAFFSYADHIIKETGLTLIAVMIGSKTLTRQDYIAMTDETEHARQRAIWNEWWWDEGWKAHDAMLMEAAE